MNTESSNLLRLLALAALFLIIIGVALGRIRRLEKEIDRLQNAPADTVKILRVDTVKVDNPVPVHHYIKSCDTVVISNTLTDTVKELVFLPREYLTYKDSNYRAVVSGVQPRLDSIEIYSRTATVTVTKTVTQVKKTRWGLGLQAGYGWNGKKAAPYIGAGVQYNLFSW